VGWLPVAQEGHVQPISACTTRNPSLTFSYSGVGRSAEVLKKSNFQIADHTLKGTVLATEAIAVSHKKELIFGLDLSRGKHDRP
jgi:hypothetical protein